MNYEVIHANACAIADRIVGELLGSQPSGLVLSIDVGGSLFDNVARDAARSPLHQFISCPSLVRYRSYLQSTGKKPTPSDVIDKPILFGRVDGFMRIENDNETFESYSPYVEEIATRAIDSWASGRPALRHIHFGEPQLAVDQTAGAAQSFARDRPVATYYTSGLNRERLLSQLRHFDYMVLDMGAADVFLGEPNALTDFGWIAFPAERHAEVLALLSDEVAGRFELYSKWQDVMVHNAPVRQQRSRSVFGLPTNAPQVQRNFLASDIIVEDDCYPIESDGVNSWRWLGPRSRTRLILPCALPGIYQIEMNIIASHLQSGLGTCRVLVEGREVRATIHGLDQGTIHFIGQLEARNYTGSMAVDLISPGAVTPVGADTRALRLNVQSIAVSPWR